MITKKTLLEALPSLKEHDDVLINDIVQRLNAKNPALNFELALHALLERFLPEGLTVLEAVGALECVKCHLQNNFRESMQQQNPQPENVNSLWLQ